MRACDYSIFRIKYTDRQQHRTYESGDSEFSHWEYNVPMNYLCVAPTQDLALAAFKRYHHGEFIGNIEVELIGTCNDLVYLQ
jgi:hypothetical protein